MKNYISKNIVTKYVSLALLVFLLGTGIYFKPINRGTVSLLGTQFAAIPKANSCMPKEEYEKAKITINQLDADLMDQYVVLGKVKNRIKELQDSATVILNDIAKLESATTSANTIDLEKKLELKTRELAVLNSIVTQRSEINTQESNLPKNRSDLQKKEAEKTSISNEINTLNRRVSALEKITETKTKLDTDDAKLKVVTQELNDRRTLDAYVSTQANLASQIKYWQSFKNNPTAAKNAVSLQAQFDKNKIAQDTLSKKYTSAQGVITLRLSSILLAEYNRSLLQVNASRNSYNTLLSQYNRTYTKDSNLTREQLLTRVESVKKSLSDIDVSIQNLKNSIDSVTKNIPALKAKFVADVKAYYKEFYNRNETNNLYTSVKLPDIKPIELEVSKLTGQIEAEKQKAAQVIADLKSKKTELAQLVTRISFTSDAFKIAEDRKDTLAKNTTDTKKMIENVEVCTIEKNITNTTPDGNGTTTQSVGFVAPVAVSNAVAQITSVSPAPGAQVSPEDSTLIVTFDRDVTLNGIFGANYASGPMNVSGNTLSVSIDNPVPGEHTVSYTVGLDTLDSEGNVVSGQYSYSTSYFVTGEGMNQNDMNGNQTQNLKTRNQNGLDGDVCCMCIYGDVTENGEQTFKKSCDEQFADNKCDFFRRTKHYARTASDVAEGVNRFPDVCPATKFKNVHLFYELHGEKRGEEEVFCSVLPTAIIKKYAESQGEVPENIAITHGKCNAFNDLSQADSSAAQLSEMLKAAGLVNVTVTITGNQNNSGVDGKGRDSGVCAGKATYEVCSTYSERTLDECPAVGSFCLPSSDNNTTIKCMENGKVKSRTCVQTGISDNGLVFGEYR